MFHKSADKPYRLWITRQKNEQSQFRNSEFLKLNLSSDDNCFILYIPLFAFGNLRTVRMVDELHMVHCKYLLKEYNLGC